MSDELEQLCINTVRFLSVDAVQKANSGHPGMPLGAASMSIPRAPTAAVGVTPDATCTSAGVLLCESGFTIDSICARAKALLGSR